MPTSSVPFLFSQVAQVYRGPFLGVFLFTGLLTRSTERDWQVRLGLGAEFEVGGKQIN